jgi:hypothetical protein
MAFFLHCVKRSFPEQGLSLRRAPTGWVPGDVASAVGRLLRHSDGRSVTHSTLGGKGSGVIYCDALVPEHKKNTTEFFVRISAAHTDELPPGMASLLGGDGGQRDSELWLRYSGASLVSELFVELNEDVRAEASLPAADAGTKFDTQTGARIN